MVYLRIVEVLILWFENLDSITFDYAKFDEITSIFDKINKNFSPDEDVQGILSCLKSEEEKEQMVNLYKILALIDAWSGKLQLYKSKIVEMAEHLIETLKDADIFSHAHTRLNSIVFKILCLNWQRLVKEDSYLMCKFSNFIIAYMKCSLPKLIDTVDVLKKNKDTLIQSHNSDGRLEYKFTVKDNEVI